LTVYNALACFVALPFLSHNYQVLILLVLLNTDPCSAEKLLLHAENVIFFVDGGIEKVFKVG